MAFVPAPNIVQVEMRATRFGQHVENRLMVDVLTAPTAEICSELAQMFWDWWEESYAVVLSASTILTEVVATDMSQQNGAQVTYAPDTTTAGLRAATPLPNEVSLCVSLRTDSRGRSARGRFYALSVCQDQMADANTISVAAAGEYVAVVAGLMPIIRAAGYEPVIVSYRSNNAPRPGGPVYFPITGATLVDNIVDSQRRRKPGVGA